VGIGLFVQNPKSGKKEAVKLEGGILQNSGLILNSLVG